MQGSARPQPRAPCALAAHPGCVPILGYAPICRKEEKEEMRANAQALLGGSEKERGGNSELELYEIY